jgi:hypothetical protein
MFINEKNKNTELTKFAQNWKNKELNKPYECWVKYIGFTLFILFKLNVTLLTVNLPKINNAINSKKKIEMNKFVLLTSK